MINWTGDIMDNLSKWEPEVYMRIPDGVEFIAPVPEPSNHLGCVWVFSPEARTIHVDDCIMYFKPSGLLGALTKVAGKAVTFDFHLSFNGPGIKDDVEAPMMFKEWVQGVIDDWDFDNACCAHIGNKIGGAKELLVKCLEDNEKKFEKLTRKREKSDKGDGDDKEDVDDEEWDQGDGDDKEDVGQFNVEGCECG